MYSVLMPQGYDVSTARWRRHGATLHPDVAQALLAPEALTSVPHSSAAANPNPASVAPQFLARVPRSSLAANPNPEGVAPEVLAIVPASSPAANPNPAGVAPVVLARVPRSSAAANPNPAGVAPNSHAAQSLPAEPVPQPAGSAALAIQEPSTEDSPVVRELKKMVKSLIKELADAKKRAVELDSSSTSGDTGAEEDMEETDENLPRTVDAGRQRLRRICERKKNGSLLVPPEIHQKFVNGGNDRDRLLKLLAKHNFDKELLGPCIRTTCMHACMLCKLHPSR